MIQSPEDAVKVIKNYRALYQKDIITELKGLSASYARIKHHLSRFIVFGIIEEDYPHDFKAEYSALKTELPPKPTSAESQKKKMPIGLIIFLSVILAIISVYIYYNNKINKNQTNTPITVDIIELPDKVDIGGGLFETTWKLIIKKKEKTIKILKIGHGWNVALCLSSDNRYIFYFRMHSVGHFYYLYKYDIKNDTIKEITSVSGFVGMFKSGIYKDLLLIGVLDFSNHVNNPSQYFLIDKNGKEIKKIGGQSERDKFIERNKNDFVKSR